MKREIRDSLEKKRENKTYGIPARVSAGFSYTWPEGGLAPVFTRAGAPPADVEEEEDSSQSDTDTAEEEEGQQDNSEAERPHKRKREEK
jgi:hypothetical protein